LRALQGIARGIGRSGWATLTAGVLALAATAASAGAAGSDHFDTVVIDAGHGGEDTGARGVGGVVEKELVLRIALDLSERLRTNGLRVVLTREDDVFVPLERRTAIANDARGDLFVSIHGNAARDTEIGGSETYFLALEASDADAARVAARENRAFEGAGADDVAVVSDPFIALLGDLITTEYLHESSEMAQRIQTELGGVDALRSRGVKQALFVVLTGVQMPAVLVEIGFVTNAQDARTLMRAGGRENVVAALERAVMAFARRYDARRGDPVPAKADP
jgi:N-acetylmuramoyl-L-alanine amidase